jgi:hypothetical protein
MLILHGLFSLIIGPIPSDEIKYRILENFNGEHGKQLEAH